MIRINIKNKNKIIKYTSKTKCAMMILIPLVTFSYISAEQHFLDTGNNNNSIKESFYKKPKQIRIPSSENIVLRLFKKAQTNKEQQLKRHTEKIVSAKLIKPKQSKKRHMKGGETAKHKVFKNKNKINIEGKENKPPVAKKSIQVKLSAYIAHCQEGCTGTTRTGVDVTQSIYYKGYRVIATDPGVIPLNSIVEVSIDGKTFKAIAIDTGGAIVGNKVDLLVATERDAINFGKQSGTISIIS
ncbi:3D domain-containing protein [Bacillus atrophaeus]|uniref:3D domain-containing protein n=2 Tax=Bacillus atrophaeus TaxID=1452 RepID=UPI00227F6CF4|nr:3D domain-containing protein [Bacillus atrophaeus]MCY8499395.1 3D domain-containing protein [Bacillus atrophaeus]MCY8814557.1 3D domain-containing protein [Bacillus atrophaeus]MCY8823159.1 3D domain-containing protein [Bacillus atrophaeus]MCY8834958.1 3D domain-containing protein [Bacillus atrophaeus]MCY8837601.1 3D domain-containing protein [Bacillus atrophaeus]